MSFWTLFDGGPSMPETRTFGQRLTLWCGRQLALRHRFVVAPKSCLIHPDARIHPRSGQIRFGEGCTVAADTVIQGNVSLGNNCSVQAFSMLIGYGTRNNPEGRILIGNGVRIAPHVMIIAGDHVFENAQTPIHEQGLRLRPIVIEDDVWVAGRVSIVAGVTIGRGSVIGAGAVVTSNIPPFSVAVGCPAKVVKQRGTSGIPVAKI